MSSKDKDIEWVKNATGMNTKKARAALEKSNWQRDRAVEERLKPSEDITDIFGSSDDDEDEEPTEIARGSQPSNNKPTEGGQDETRESNQDEDDDGDRGGPVQRKKRRILDEDDEASKEGDEDPESSETASRKRKIIEDSDDEADKGDDDDHEDRPRSKTVQDDDDEEDDEGQRKNKDREDDDEEDKDDIGEKDSDDYGDGAELKDDDLGAALPDISDDDSSDEEKPIGGQSQNIVYDFDVMMAKKKEENSRRRRKRNYDIINDNDDIIDDIIKQMKEAVDEDFQLNKNCMTATRKLKLLPFVTRQLRKVDLRDAFLDSGVLSVITDWLTPLPDRSLPHTNIRENLMKILLEFNIYDTDKIKASGIGKAIMYLYKHPKETKENKQRARQLISSWSRPIFQLESSFSSMSREEREQRDLDLKNRHKRNSVVREDDSDSDAADSSRRQSTSQTAKPKEPVQPPVATRPGEKGWIPRARVPAPSMKDYVIRPKSNIDAEISRNSKKQMNMLDKYLRSQQERKRASRVQRAVNMKIDRA